MWCWVEDVCEKCTGRGNMCIEKSECWESLKEVTCLVTLGLFDSNTSCNNIPLVTIADGLCITIM